MPSLFITNAKPVCAPLGSEASDLYVYSPGLSGMILEFPRPSGDQLCHQQFAHDEHVEQFAIALSDLITLIIGEAYTGTAAR